jgi:hypothetical protein
MAAAVAKNKAKKVRLVSPSEPEGEAANQGN